MISFSVFHYPPCLTITLPPPLLSAPSAPPQEVRLLSLSSTCIKVIWVAPPTDSRHGEIVRYSLAYQALTGEEVERHQVSGIGVDVTSYVLEDLEKCTEYLVWVRAHTDVGPGPESPAARIRTKEDGMLIGSSLGLPGNTNPSILTLLLFRCCSLVLQTLTKPNRSEILFPSRNEFRLHKSGLFYLNIILVTLTCFNTELKD